MREESESLSIVYFRPCESPDISHPQTPHTHATSVELTPHYAQSTDETNSNDNNRRVMSQQNQTRSEDYVKVAEAQCEIPASKDIVIRKKTLETGNIESVPPHPVVETITIHTGPDHTFSASPTAPLTPFPPHPSLQPTIVHTTVTAVTEQKPIEKLAHFTLYEYAKKFRGRHVKTPDFIGFRLCLWAFFASFLGIAIPTVIQDWIIYRVEDRTDLLLTVASFGASAVLIYSATESDLAQPRNVLGGQMISALMGTIVRKIFPLSLEYQWVADALAVASAITAMNLTRTLHPPGGATAFIACSSTLAEDLGFLFVPLVGAGISIMLLVALIVNNLDTTRTYPKFWY